MLGKLSELVSGETLASWLLIALLVGYFIYKEWPEFRKRMSKEAVKEQKDEMIERTVDERLDSIENELEKMDERLRRDYQRLNLFDQELEKSKNYQSNTAEELGIIMEALMGVLSGLQEIGANGPTKEAKSKIQNYLNKKAHLAPSTSLDK